ncbi:MAG TPA: hypothetical protein VJV79_24975, partial [Polyangiaceae bacterium]|nr:hypothetical protein [Polyangiaceae bacterium]
MTRRLPRSVALASVLAVLGATVPAAAQPAELLAFDTWNLSFSYRANSSFQKDGQSYDYSVVVNGNAILERSEDSPGHYFVGDPKLTVSLNYSGSALDEQGCGLVETVQSASAAPCNVPSSLYLDETRFDLELGCSLAKVSHAFEWTCDELFPYPVDGDALTEWPWTAQELALDGTSFRTKFDYPASGTTLTGKDAGDPVLFLSPLFTAIASGTGAPGSYSFDFTLTPGKAEELELIIDGPDYERWRPSATRTGDAGEPLQVTATLETADGTEPSVRIERFVWELKDTSSEPGIAMNYPRDAMDSELDLRLKPWGPSTHEISAVGQIADQYNPMGWSDTIKVEPYDWGGWSTLSVTAYLADGRSVKGKLRGAAEPDARLPKRAKDSLVSDHWKLRNGVSDQADEADDDSSPEGDGTPGDGLTLYQEYRGFYDGNEHLDKVDPKVKDFFVLNSARAATLPGILRFKAISGLDVHFQLTEEELPASRIINANRRVGPSVTDQHAVILKIDGGLENKAKAFGGPGNPKKITHVGLMKDWESLRLPLVSSNGEYFALIVAHELFHCVNVYHHGDIDIDIAWGVGLDEATKEKALFELRRDGRSTPIHVLNEYSTDVTSNTIDEISRLSPAARLVKMGVDNGQHSGDDACVMRYSNSEAYESKFDSTARYIVKERPGTGLCQSPAGFGVNDSSRDPHSRYGDAADLRGNCRDQVLVTDAVDAPG